MVTILIYLIIFHNCYDFALVFIREIGGLFPERPFECKGDFPVSSKWNHDS